MTAQEELELLLKFQKEPPTFKVQINWIKDRAFKHRCRNNADIPKMIDALTERMRLAALTERLLS